MLFYRIINSCNVIHRLVSLTYHHQMYQLAAFPPLLYPYLYNIKCYFWKYLLLCSLLLFTCTSLVISSSSSLSLSSSSSSGTFVFAFILGLQLYFVSYIHCKPVHLLQSSR